VLEYREVGLRRQGASREQLVGWMQQRIPGRIQMRRRNPARSHPTGGRRRTSSP